MPSAPADQAALVVDEVHEDVVAQVLVGREERPSTIHLRYLLDKVLQIVGDIEHEGIDPDVFSRALRNLGERQIDRLL